jgi:hypothetical protein
MPLFRALFGLCLAVCTLAQSAAPALADAASPWSPGPNAVGDDTYTGFIDAPASGSTVVPSQTLVVRGWVVDHTAAGWSGIDDVQIYLGLQDQGGTLLVRGNVGQQRDDVAAATGNPYWGRVGFSASFTGSGLVAGSNVLTVYAHSPAKGWWYRQLQLQVAPLPAIGFADDPLLVAREVTPSLDVDQSTPSMILTGYAIDRNMPPNVSLGVGGSGVSGIQFYLDGPRGGGGTFLGNATLGMKNREATGFGDRFLQSGWQMTVHPSDFTVDRHEFFIYAASAFWPNETLNIIPFNVR